MHDDPTLPALPPMSPATLLRALFKRPAPSAATAPAASLSTRYRLAALDLAHVARYRQALGFAGQHVPLTFYYLLAQRAHLATMLGASFPFRLVGAIHVDNRLASGADPVPGRPLELATTVRIVPPAANGAVHALLETAAFQDGQPVFAGGSTYLVVRGRRGGPRPPGPEATAPAQRAAWALAPGSGRAYAALSGDWNPIHLWPWSARLMGLRAPIIHGMHTMGRACAELERADGRRVTRLDGRFRAPIELGATAALAADLAGGRYIVDAGGRTAVEGTFGFDASRFMHGA